MKKEMRLTALIVMIVVFSAVCLSFGGPRNRGSSPEYLMTVTAAAFTNGAVPVVSVGFAYANRAREAESSALINLVNFASFEAAGIRFTYDGMRATPSRADGGRSNELSMGETLQSLVVTNGSDYAGFIVNNIGFDASRYEGLACYRVKVTTPEFAPAEVMQVMNDTIKCALDCVLAEKFGSRVPVVVKGYILMGGMTVRTPEAGRIVVEEEYLIFLD